MLDSFLKHTERPYLDRARAKPFVKWAGGKRTLIPEIARLLPDSITTYWEPFLGGGAVFFALDSRITTAKLSDVNPELALTYQMVKNRTEELIGLLEEHQEKHSPPYYYQVRKQSGLQKALDVAARFIYLNKTCYNGLYRVNKSGVFNVPIGRYVNPVVCDAENLREASKVLQKATVTFGDFENVEPGDKDFIYCDPPYDGTFTGYGKDGFGEAEQKRLKAAALKWHKLGAAVMVSNADTELIRGLYSGAPFTIHETTAPRNINCKTNGRGAASELLITTYGQ